MSNTFKWKTLVILASILLSFYFLTPSLFNFQERIEAANRAGVPVPSYISFFPKKGVNLGLDLRGGLYVELNVDLQEALKNRLGVLLTQMEQQLGPKFPGLKLERVAAANRVRVTLPDDKKGDFLNELRDNFGDIFEQATLVSELHYRVEGVSSLSDFLPKLQTFLNPQGVADIEVQDQSLRLILRQPGSQDSILAALQNSPFAANLKSQTPVGITILQVTELYSKTLRDLTLKQAVEAVRNRVDRYGVSEAGIQLQGEDRIIVEIPGVKDPDRVINIIRKTGLLEFRLVDEDVKQNDVSTWVKEAQTQNNLAGRYEKEAVEKINQALKGKIPADDEVLFEVERDPITKEIVNGVPYVVKKRADVTGDMLRNAQVGINNNEPHVSLSFNKIGTKNFGELTKNNIGKKLAIILDGFVSKAPVIQSAIMDGEAQITLGYGSYQSLLTEANDLALLLREGALPASLTVATRTVVGPSLGADSIRQGLTSMVIAALVIVLFMAVYYRWGGILADVALIINMLFLFALLAVLQASLSLPGIAGIVLTMGMAVDANVIIFERMREELRLGKTAKAVVEAGYQHAMSAIIDSNLTTLIAGVVLYQFGTGPIKGFATTLMIGIVTTMVTAVFMTRVVYDYFIYVRKINKVSI